MENQEKAGGEINLSPGNRLQSGRTGSGPGPLITIGSLWFRIRKQTNTDFDLCVCVSTGPTYKSSDYDADKNLHKNDQTNQLDKWNMNKHELHKKIKLNFKQILENVIHFQLNY